MHDEKGRLWRLRDFACAFVIRIDIHVRDDEEMETRQEQQLE